MALAEIDGGALHLSFQELNSRLIEAHERELQIWRREVERLQTLAEGAGIQSQSSQDSQTLLARQTSPFQPLQVDANGKGPVLQKQRSLRGSNGRMRSKENLQTMQAYDSCRPEGDTGSAAEAGEDVVEEAKEIAQHHLDDEGEMDLRGVWQDLPDEGTMQIAHGSPARFNYSDKEMAITESPTPVRTEDEHSCKMPVFQPTSSIRLTWDLVGAALIAYDSVVIPFEAAFRPAPTTFSVFMDWSTTIFWTIDILFTFFTGYHSRGSVIIIPSRIAGNYLRTWLSIDVAVVSLDYFSGTLMKQEAGTDVSGLGRIIRGMRAIRVLRLLRLLKLKRIFAQIQDLIDSEYMYLVASLGKLLCFILTLNHFIACVWFFVGFSMLEGGMPSWVAENNMFEADIWYQYTTSLHWTLTQFTPASMEVFPMNVAERSMAVVVLLFSLVAFSSFLGSISSSMTALRNMNQDSNKQFWLLRRFLRQEQVALPVSSRILKYLEYTFTKHERLLPVDVKVLKHLSAGLRDELQYELTYVKMVQHPLFRTMVIEMEIFMVQVCSVAAKDLTLAGGDLLFHRKDPAQHMYFLVHGELDYLPDQANDVTHIKEYEALSEATLWCPWSHKGRAHARTAVELLSLDAVKFGQVALKYIDAWNTCAQYALVFLESFTEAGPSDTFRDPDFYESVPDAIRTIIAQGRSDRTEFLNTAQSRRKTVGRSTRKTVAHVTERKGTRRGGRQEGRRFFWGASPISSSGAGIQWVSLWPKRTKGDKQAKAAAMRASLAGRRGSARRMSEISEFAEVASIEHFAAPENNSDPEVAEVSQLAEVNGAVDGASNVDEGAAGGLQVVREEGTADEDKTLRQSI